MRRALLAAGISLASFSAQAHELDEWCSSVQKASSLIICSDTYLKDQAVARNKLFEHARVTMSPANIKILTKNQNEWVMSYTAACGVGRDDTMPFPVPTQVVECYRRESEKRTAYLTSKILGKSMPQEDIQKAIDDRSTPAIQYTTPSQPTLTPPGAAPAGPLAALPGQQRATTPDVVVPKSDGSKTWVIVMSIYVAPPTAVDWPGPWSKGMIMAGKDYYDSEGTCRNEAVMWAARVHAGGMLAPIRYECVSFPNGLPVGAPR